jgi:hypothetical protein
VAVLLTGLTDSMKMPLFMIKVKKVKISLLQAMEAHRVCEKLRLPHYLDKRLIDGGKVISPTHRPQFTPRFLYF